MIVSVLFLIGLFLSISGYLLMLGVNFIGLSYLLVYVGAVYVCMIRCIKSNSAAWVKLPLYKLPLIINSYLGFIFLINKCYYPKCTTYSVPLHFKTSTSKLCLHKKYYSTFFTEENFLKWFVGFSDSEANFTILPYKNKAGNITSFTFRFIIELHIDDIGALNLIKSKLNIGSNIVVYGSSCKFTVIHSKDIYVLLGIFDKYNLFTTKHLDYLDFKKAFLLYNTRDKANSKEALTNQLVKIKNGMNANRTIFCFPADHKIVINNYWLLGFIEGDGSFYLSRTDFYPSFSITQSELQLPVLQKIKEFLENNLGFDKYSLFKLINSSVILISVKKAVNNNKPIAVLRIKNTNVLTNYLIPYLENMTFITKKGMDFNDFKLISTAMYNGAYRIEEIKILILNLSYTMNNYRLSTSLDKNKINNFSNKDKDIILKAEPTVKHLSDGRQLDIITGKLVNRRWANCIYEIINEKGEILLASTLNDAAVILDVNFRTIGRHLESEDLFLTNEFVQIKRFKIRRIPVFYP